MEFDVNLQRLTVLDENEGSPDEPYLMILRIKVDGSTVSVLGGRAGAEVTARGGHGSLGSSSDDMEKGESVSIPAALGRWRGQLDLIDGLPRSLAESSTLVAVAVVALEEDATKSSAVVAGREALEKAVRTELDRALTGALATLTAVDVGALENQIEKTARTAVADAVESATVSAFSFMPIGSLLDVGGMVDPDDYVGFRLAGPFTFASLRNVAAGSIPIRLTMRRSGEGRYRVTGQVSGRLVEVAEVDVTSRSVGRLDVMGRGEDRRIYHSHWDGTAWSQWSAIGQGIFLAGPAVTHRGDRLDVFGQGDDRRIYHASWNGNGWSGWSPIGEGTFLSGPAAAARGSSVLDVFGRGDDRRIYHASWNGQVWSSWGPVGDGLFTSAPAVCARGRSGLDVFARGDDRRIYHSHWNRREWTGWAAIGDGTFTSAPAAASWGSSRLDVFARGDDRRMYHTTWNGGWTGWVADTDASGGVFTSSPGATSAQADRLDVVALGDDRRIYHNAWLGNQWSGWLPDTPAGSFL